MKRSRFTPLQIIGIVIFSLLVVLPQLATAGFFFEELGQHSLWLSAIGGILGGLLISPKLKTDWLIRCISGLVVGLGVSLCTQLYFAIFVEARQQILKLEIGIPLLIGSLLGVLLYKLMKKNS